MIGASTALEMADEDSPEYLKKLSENVAMEADQSDEEQKKIEHEQEEKQRLLQQKKEEDNTFTPAKAR